VVLIGKFVIIGFDQKIKMEFILLHELRRWISSTYPVETGMENFHFFFFKDVQLVKNKYFIKVCEAG